MSFIPSTQSELAVSNLAETIENISDVCRFGATTPVWLGSQVDSIAETLDSYALAGGDPSELSQSVRACEVMVYAVLRLLDSGYHLKPFVDEDWFFDRMESLVSAVNEVTETLGEPCYGASLCADWNYFQVQCEIEDDCF